MLLQCSSTKIKGKKKERKEKKRREKTNIKTLKYCTDLPPPLPLPSSPSL